MSTPDETTVWIGLDIGKTEHFADVLDEAGSPLFAVAVANDEAAIEALIARAESFGSPALVVDQPGSLARLVLAVAARRGVPVAYVPGLVMRRAADLYPGESKTDRRDAFVLADTGRTRRHQVYWLDAGGDELLEQLRILNGYDTDLAADATRASLRSRRRFRVLTEPAYVQLRKWISEFDWERWNSQIEADSEAGRLEFLIAEAREAGERGALDEL